MPEFDDIIQSAQFKPQLEYNSGVNIERYTVLLKDGETTATIYPINRVEDMPPGLLAFLCDEFNMEIERGDTVPFFDTLDIEAFQNFWFASFAGVMVLGNAPLLDTPRQWEKECLGTFFVRPNYPGRSSHICTAGFLVNAGIRGKGIGHTLADCYLQWAPRLGYTYAIFNLVFETNAAARKIWESLNFKRIGRVKSAGILKGHDTAVDAIIYGRELINNADPAIGAYRFDKIKFYLETGRYPAMADRQEKSRLRSSASHYRLEDGRLMLKGREVVSDPARQLQICTEVHMNNHGGINKTTAIVTERYHWTRIKDTVATAIRNCPECRDPTKEAPILKKSAIPKRIATGTSISRKSNKVFYSQPNNPNARNLIRSRNANDEVEAMVAAAQLHNLPAHHRNDAADALLSQDFSGLDDGIIAAVETAQRSQGTNQTQQPSYSSVAAAAVSGPTNHYHHYHEYSNHPEYQESGVTDHVIDGSRDDEKRSKAGSPHKSFSNESINVDGNDQKSHSNNNDADTQTSKRKDKTSMVNESNRDSIPVDPEVSAFDHHVNSPGEEMEIARALIQANEDVQDQHDHPVDEMRIGASGMHNEKSDIRNRSEDDSNIFFKGS